MGRVSLDALALALTRLAAEPTTAAQREEAFLSVLDTLAVSRAARGAPLLERLSSIHGAVAAGPDTQVLMAATQAHVLDYDDVQMSSVCHASAVLVPALWALRGRWPRADAAGAYQAGLRTIAAMARLLGARHYMAGWHATATLGPFGVAAALVHMAQADAQVLRHALSLAACQASGLQRSFGSDAKPLQAGLAASAGVRAASWALAGMQGGDVLAADGFLDLYGGDGSGVATVQEALAPAVHDQVSRKASPCCYAGQRLIAAAAQLHGRSSPWQPGMRLRLRAQRGTLLPLVVRAPDSANDARFCGVYLAATALLDGAVGLRHFERQSLQREDIHQCMAAIEIQEVGEFAGALEDGVVCGALLREDGSVLAEVEIEHFPGSPQWPLSTQDLQAKVLDCCAGDAQEAASLWSLGRILVPQEAAA